MTILIPIDFSKVSKVAVFYAVNMATKRNADMILFTAMLPLLIFNKNRLLL